MLNNDKTARKDLVVLGIDPGTAKMGYSVSKIFADGTFQLIESNEITTSKDSLMHDRLVILDRELQDICGKHEPNVMVIEKLFFNTNVKTALTVGQARGVALLNAGKFKLDVFEYTALQAKMSLTGYGRSSKKEMQEAVKKELGLQGIIKSDDANDAVAITLCFLKKDCFADEALVALETEDAKAKIED